mgnify:CR=1 FL=1
MSGSGETGAVVWAIALPIISSAAFIGSSTYISFHMSAYIESLRLRLHPRAEKGFSPVGGTDGPDRVGAPSLFSQLPRATPGSGGSTPEHEEQEGREGGASWDTTLIRLLLLVAVAFTGIAHYVRTTFLLGAFMAGVAFSAVPGMHASWATHMPTVSTWTARLFFASIGFTIPVRELFSVEALYFGLLLTFIAIVSKVATGVFEWEDKWAIGWAMVGGE